MFRARVIGRNIAQVRFHFAGRWHRTIKAKQGQTVFSALLHPRGRSSAARRVSAKIKFKAATAMKPVTLRFVYQSCAKAARSPQFTG